MSALLAAHVLRPSDVPGVPPKYRLAISGSSTTSWAGRWVTTRPLSITMPVGRQPHAEPHVLLHDQHRLAVLAHEQHGVVDRLQRARVEAEGRLVEQDQHRVEHQRAGELHHPALAAGQVAGPVGLAVGHDREQRLDLVVAAAHQRPVAADDVAAEQHVLAHGQGREQRVRLRHLADPLGQDLRRAERVDALTVEQHLAEPRA